MGTIGKLLPGSWSLKKYGNCALTSDSPYSTNNNCIGQTQTRTPEPSGRFQPGVFRLNPVVIRKTTGTCPVSLITGVVKDSTTPCKYLYRGELRGQYAAKDFVIPAFKPGWDDSLAGWAIQEAYAKMNEPRVGVALMVAEAAETLSLLRNPLKNLTDLCSTLKWKRGLVNPRMALGDFFSGSWLTFQYGVIPLMMDIQSIIEAISNGLNRDRDTLIRLRGGVREEDTTTVLSSSDTVVGPFRWRRATTSKTSKKATCVVYSKWVGAMSAGLNDFGFDIRQVPALLWEILPYSFVGDWFLNVGSWLSAIMPSPEHNVLGNCVSIKTETTTTVSCVSMAYTQTRAGVVESNDTGKFQWKTTELDRRVNLSMPVLPASNFDVSNLTHIVSSLALIWQQLPQSWRKARR